MASCSCKRSVITLETKLEVITMLKEGKSQRSVSASLNIPKSIVADIWKQRVKIEDHVSSSDCPASVKKRCIVREGQFEQLDKAYTTHGLPSNVLKALRYRAPCYRRKLYPDGNADSFKASSGWLYRFSCRHGI